MSNLEKRVAACLHEPSFLLRFTLPVTGVLAVDGVEATFRSQSSLQRMSHLDFSPKNCVQIQYSSTSRLKPVARASLGVHADHVSLLPSFFYARVSVRDPQARSLQMYDNSLITLDGYPRGSPA